MELVENKLDVQTYQMLRHSVGWRELTNRQAKVALENSLYTLCAYEDGIPVGMGRIVGDRVVICYVQDLVVHKKAQSKGIGAALLEKLKDFAKTLPKENEVLMLDLMCATGREEFYKSHGFIERPNDRLGPGMIMYLKNEE